MKDSIVLHHSADTSPRDQYDGIWSYHNRGAGGKMPPGFGIAYPFLIEHSGAIKQGRGENETTYHAGSWKWNVRSIGICLAGDFTRQQPSEAQLDSLCKLIIDLQTKWGIPDSAIYLHKEVRPNPTSCPGIDLRQLFLERKDKFLQKKIEQLQRPSRSPTRRARILEILARFLP